MTSGIRERVHRFGPEQRLVGILTTGRKVSADLPHVVVVNAGIVHRVGPSRLYVDMARAVAALGYPVLRIDIAGLGDSGPVTGGASLTESAINDVRAAMDHLEATRKTTGFLLFGLCSGANYATVTAFSDPRVIGLMLIDPSVSRTRKSAVVHAMRRMTHLSTLRELLTLRHPVFRRLRGGRLSAAVSVAQAAEGQSEQRADAVSSSMSVQDANRSMVGLIARGVHMMFVFTGGVNHVYNYHDQLYDLLPGVDFRDQLHLHYVPDTDHTVSDVASRSRLLRMLADWLNQTFPARVTAEREADAVGRVT